MAPSNQFDLLVILTDTTIATNTVAVTTYINTLRTVIINVDGMI